MTTFHEALKKIFKVVDGFINTSLKNESLSKATQRERTKLQEVLQKFYGEYEYLNPSIVDEGSSSSSKDAHLDESRNTLGSNTSNDDDQYADDIADTTVKALTNPYRTGYLQKKRTDLFGMLSKQKCYFVLHNNVMYWFKKPGNKKQQGAFFVTGYEFREIPQTDKDIQKKEFPFELVNTAKKTYQFVAETKDDLEAWKQAVLKASNYIPPPSVSAVSLEMDFEEHDPDDVYEPIEDVAEEVKRSLSQQDPKRMPDLPTTPKFHVPELDENDEPIPEYDFELTYDAAESEAVQQPFPPSPLSKTQQSPRELPPPDIIPDDMDEIYEAVDIMPPTGPDTKVPVPDSPPPLPPHNPVAAPAESQLPPPLPSRSAPAKELPPLPPRKRILTLGELLKEDYENMFFGIWKCTGATDDELSFDEGEIIRVINRELDAENWWVGELKGKLGLVPKPFLCPAYEVAA